MTIRIPRSALRKARIAAAQRYTSVSAIVAEYLQRLDQPLEASLDTKLDRETVLRQLETHLSDSPKALEMVTRCLKRLDRPYSEALLEKEIEREIVKLGKEILANIRAMRRSIRKAIEAVERSERRA